MDDAPGPPLPTVVATLQGMVRALLPTVADLRKTVGALQHRIDDLTRRLYGRTSERVTDDAPAPARPPTGSADPPRQRLGHGRRPLPGHLPRERVEVDLAEAEKACPCCGRTRVRIGAERSEQLDYRPASLFVVERVRHTYACPSCSRTADPVDDPVPTITTGPLPAQPIGKGLPGPGLVAHVVVAKFTDDLPLHRQAGILARHGVDVARSTIGGWVAAAAGVLKPLVDRMAKLVRQSRVIQTDDTPVPVLDPGARRTRTGHLWVYLGDADHPYAVFNFTPTYSGDGPQGWLGDYAGYVQADALRQYDPLFDRPPPRPAEVGCWAHARRKFYDARVTDPARAHEALARIRRLYDVEAEAKPLDDTGRLGVRQAVAPASGRAVRVAGGGAVHGVAEEPVGRGGRVRPGEPSGPHPVHRGRVPGDRQQRQRAGPPGRRRRAEELPVRRERRGWEVGHSAVLRGRHLPAARDRPVRLPPGRPRPAPVTAGRPRGQPPPGQVGSGAGGCGAVTRAARGNSAPPASGSR